MRNDRKFLKTGKASKKQKYVYCLVSLIEVCFSVDFMVGFVSNFWILGGSE